MENNEHFDYTIKDGAVALSDLVEFEDYKELYERLAEIDRRIDEYRKKQYNDNVI